MLSDEDFTNYYMASGENKAQDEFDLFMMTIPDGPVKVALASSREHLFKMYGYGYIAGARHVYSDIQRHKL